MAILGDGWTDFRSGRYPPLQAFFEDIAAPPFGDRREILMPEVRPQIAFTLVNSKGWVIPSSTNYLASQVRQWADKNWGFAGGYDGAKKEGWRVRKVVVSGFRNTRRSA
jgi:hypothetical protein